MKCLSNYILLLLYFTIWINIPFMNGNNTKTDGKYKLNTKIELVEKLYLNYIISESTNEDSVCSLPKKKKITLCKTIFQLENYQLYNININKVALFVNSLACEKKLMKVKTKLFFAEEEQQMFPCYARHYPIRTNYITDDYYDKIYVSAGPIDNSIFIYIHKYDDQSHWYQVNTYIENILYLELRDTHMSIEDIRDELLKFNDMIASSNNQKQLEYIYLRENEWKDKKEDELCNLEKERKIALCRLVFDRYIYKKFFGLTVDNLVLYTGRLSDCSTQSIGIRFSKRYKNKLLQQRMLRCYTRSRMHLNYDTLHDNNLNYFYIFDGPRKNRGPRKNSVFVCLFDRNREKGVGYLYELIENIDLNNLESFIITQNNIIEKESPKSILYLRYLNDVYKIRKSIHKFKSTQKLMNMLRDLYNRKIHYINKFKTVNFKTSQLITKMFTMVEYNVVDVWGREITTNLYYIKFRLITDNTLTFAEINKKVMDYARELTELMNNRNLINGENNEEIKFIWSVSQEDILEVPGKIISYIEESEKTYI